MAKRSLANLSVEDLQAEIRGRQRKGKTLLKKHAKLAARLALVERQLAAIGLTAGSSRGGARRGPGSRARNAQSLPEALAAVMSTDKAMSVSDLAKKVRDKGYQSNSVNFNTIVNQALVKDKRFKNVSRGQYVLAK